MTDSLWDRMPKWLRAVTVIAATLWFVPPMILVLLKAAGVMQ